MCGFASFRAARFGARSKKSAPPPTNGSKYRPNLAGTCFRSSGRSCRLPPTALKNGPATTVCASRRLTASLIGSPLGRSASTHVAADAADEGRPLSDVDNLHLAGRLAAAVVGFHVDETVLRHRLESLDEL